MVSLSNTRRERAQRVSSKVGNWGVCSPGHPWLYRIVEFKKIYLELLQLFVLFVHTRIQRLRHL